MLNSLSRKLGLFYGGLIAGVLLLVLGAARIGIEGNAESIVRAEMVSSAAVFDRIWHGQYDQMDQAATVLASDYGFREAVATGDVPTVISALTNLKQRLNLPLTFLVTLDGKIISPDHAMMESEAVSIRDALDAGARRGMLMVGHVPYGAVAVPVRAPLPVGWVVFANSAGPAQMASLASLSSLRLQARVVDIQTIGTSVPVARAGSVVPVEKTENGERFLYQATPLPRFGAEGRPQALLLRFSLSEALSLYTPMLLLLLAVGAIALLIAIVGSWYLARRIAQPIVALDLATRRVSSGEHVEVASASNDEIGSLATSFNKMVVAVGERERRISHLAFHDSLTDLPNRVLLREQLDHALRRSSKDKALGVLCLDLDNFKSVNDTLGHPVGDLLLREVARRYLNCLDGDLVARLGGDEFAVLVIDDVEQIALKARKLLAAVREPFQIDGHRIATGTSIGIAIARQDGDDADTLLKNADLALYRAKRDGKGDFRFFESAMDAAAQERRVLEMDLRDALSEGQLELYFQPLFSLASNEVNAFEALLRWNHPTRGLVAPLDFIPLAEETGLIVPIGEWVLYEACRIAQDWPETIRVAVNVSAVQFRNPGLNGVIFQALTRSGLAPNRLELEITESVFIEKIEATLAALHGVRALGVRVALDDFGTGYSSLSYLRSFPFDKIKIDRSFIMDLLNDDNATAVISSITALAAALGMETTAEGVEKPEQLDILRAQGCSQIQGYLFSRPVPAAQICSLITSIDGGRRQTEARAA